VQAELKQVRRGTFSERGNEAYPVAEGAGGHDDDDMDDDDDEEEEEERRPGHRALTSATVSVKAFDPFCISVGKHELQVTLVDTPGYGESLHTEESFDVICRYVDSLFEKQLRAESSWSPRDSERLRLQDPLVHVCLYFIAPHRLKHIDIAFMRALHRKVNIVPIIAKSDTMTTKEKEEFKMQVREALQKEGIDAFAFDTPVIRQMEQQDKQEYKLPWAVIGSTDAYLDAGATVYLRKYPWGNALSSEPAHSDLPALRNLLMWSGQWHDLKMASRAKYEAWRVQRPLSRRSSAAIATAGRAAASRLRRISDAGARGRRACVRAFAAGCENVGVPPRYGARALLVLMLALFAGAAPSAVRWATGRDHSLARKLELSRQQVDALVYDKAKMVERYERQLADLRSQLIDSQSHGEVHALSERARATEAWELRRELRSATSRAELAEALLKRQQGECNLWSPIASAGAKAKEQVLAATKLVGKETADGFAQLAKEAPGYLGSAGRKTAELTRDMGAHARRLFSDLKVGDVL
jgi:septin family protein